MVGLFCWNMVTRTQIEEALNPLLEEHKLFLVELNMGTDGIIKIEADGFTSITIDQCVTISRYLRNHFGERADDYEITVSSPGLEKPFRHFNQYLKNLEKSVEVVTADGTKISGKLTTAEADFVIIQEYKRLNPKNKALKPTLSDKMTRVDMNQIKSIKKMIIF